MPTVSIIVPNYNHAKFLDQRLESVFNQTYQDFEVILLDDHSNDDSLQVLRSYSTRPKVAHFIVNDKNSGSTFSQWKKGVSAASGKYIWIAETDDVADLCFLDALVPVLDNSPSVGVAYCQSYIIDDKGQVLYSNSRWTDDLVPNIWDKPFQLEGKSAIQDYYIYKNIIPNASAVLFRKELFKTMTAPIEKFKFAGDWMTWSHLLLKSDLYFTSAHLNYFRHHAAVTRVRKSLERKSLYFMEVYALLHALVLSPVYQEKAYNSLSLRVYRKFGFKYLLSWRGFLFSQKVSGFDPHFRSRMFRTWLKKLVR